MRHLWRSDNPSHRECCARHWQQSLWGIHQPDRDRSSRRCTQHDKNRETI